MKRRIFALLCVLCLAIPVISHATFSCDACDGEFETHGESSAEIVERNGRRYKVIYKICPLCGHRFSEASNKDLGPIDPDPAQPDPQPASDPSEPSGGGSGDPPAADPSSQQNPPPEPPAGGSSDGAVVIYTPSPAPAVTNPPPTTAPETPASIPTDPTPAPKTDTPTDAPVVIYTATPPVTAPPTQPPTQAPVTLAPTVPPEKTFTPAPAPTDAKPTAVPTATKKPGTGPMRKYPVFSSRYPSRRLNLPGDPNAHAPSPGILLWPLPENSEGSSFLESLLGGGE